MINKDCINFKSIQSKIVWFPICKLKDPQKYENILVNNNECENCLDYKKIEKEEK